ncbi:MAG: replication-associated recombination protein A [Burkholderiales bacterium]|nr:replication-associated recombination protein A [Burkholderiales bacterium]NBO75942.1 replication-associated recombination protein A [Betaproteobacteria bacterium]
MAERLRPQRLQDVVGQQHLIGPGRPLQRAFEAGRLHSFILWGPPGVGKTTLARLAAQVTKSQFLVLSAVSAGIKDIRAVIEAAQALRGAQGRGTVVFIDEIHAFSKPQQDALLPHVESGLLVLIGGTTEHPGLQVTNALLSRTQVYALEPLSKADFAHLAVRALEALELPGHVLDEEAQALLVSYADGDGRRYLNLVEQVVVAAQAAGLLKPGAVPAGQAVHAPQDMQDTKTQSGSARIDAAFVQASTSPSLRRSDGAGDHYYEQISAFHKSVRSSQTDAALYWMARLLDGGVDPRQVTRRMIAIASEDIGNADPRALQLALNAAEAVDRLGLPEGELAMAQAAVYLSLAAKSNASYMAWKQAKALVRETGSLPVPLHLRNAPSKLQKQMGYGAEYRYAHDEPHAYPAGMGCWPEGLREPGWYRPSDRGLEIQLREKLNWLRSLDEAHKKGSKTGRG